MSLWTLQWRDHFLKEIQELEARTPKTEAHPLQIYFGSALAGVLWTARFAKYAVPDDAHTAFIDPNELKTDFFRELEQEWDGYMARAMEGKR